MEKLIVLVIAVVAADGALAPFIQPCQSSDSACHLQTIQQAIPALAAGVPALGMIPLDPMHIDRVDADQAGLTVQFTDTVVKGLRNCQVLDFKRTGTRQNIELKCSVTLIGTYKLGGQLLVLPVQGDGRYKIKIRDIHVKTQYEMGEKSISGARHWTIKSWKHSSNVHGGAEFQFQNLFNGNKQLSDSVHQFANSNWRDIFQEVAPPIVKAIVGKIVDQVQMFFHKVPLSELSLD